MLADAGIERSQCSISNVFLERPKDNDLGNWLVSKKQGGVGLEYKRGKYFPFDKDQERLRLYREIDLVKPNIVVAMGNTAIWATIGRTGVSSVRGTVTPSPYINTPYGPLKVMATMHPAAIIRQYELRATTVIDLIKAKAESAFPEIKLPRTQVLIKPNLRDLALAEEILVNATLMSYDIETACGQITCIGFATRDFAICVPFVAYQDPTKSYWSQEEEILVWKAIRRILSSDTIKVTQNGLYDIQYLLKYGIAPRMSLHDTMLLHHSIMPELPKSLGFLGSVYTNFPSWKHMRKTETLKREE